MAFGMGRVSSHDGQALRHGRGIHQPPEILPEVPMIAFQDIRSEMRKNAVHLTSPAAIKPGRPAHIVRSHEPEIDEGEETHIEPWMEIAFKALTHASEPG